MTLALERKSRCRVRAHRRRLPPPRHPQQALERKSRCRVRARRRHELDASIRALWALALDRKSRCRARASRRH
eukprot:5523395-Pyramimonas_sp.AAC.1